MRAQKGELTTWNDLHASVWQVTTKHSNFRVSTEFLQQVLIAALLCPSLTSSGCDILWKKKKKHSWSLGWDFWGSQKDSLSALDDRYDRGTQKAISHIKTKSALGPFIFFSGSLVAICHLSEKKVESARGFFLAMVGWCLPMTWDLSVFNQLVHWSQDHVGNKRLLLQTVQTLSILLMFPGVNFGTWLPK